MSAIGDQVEVFWYKPTSSDIDRYGDGGIAIIDQWILSHAKYKGIILFECDCKCLYLGIS